jgi:signal transduction histidine kinase
MSFILLSHENEDFDEVMKSGIKPVADALGIDRVSVYEILDEEAKRLKQVYVWREHTVPLDIDIVEVPRVPATARWHDTLVSGKCLNEDVSKLSEAETAFFNQFGVKAVCFVPVFIRGEYWGIIALGDHTNYRYFDEPSMEIMRSAAHLCALAIMRRETELEENRLKIEIETALAKAQEASLAKREFLARMSHEMRTPLNAIMGMTHVAKLTADPQKRQGQLEKIDKAARELLRMVDDVLDVTRIEYGTFKLASAAFDFGAVMNDILQMARRITAEKKQQFHYEAAPALPAALIGDETRLKQVVVCLLVNAVKFTPENKGIRLSVGASGADSGRVTLRFTVTDSGIGIPKEKQEDIFRLFEQADGGMTRKHSGIGIGLALSRYIAEMMDGGIELVSEPGAGSAFTFTCKVGVA